MRHTIGLFGASEKGAFKIPHILHELPHVMDRLGNAPPETEGLFFAIQSILYNREVIFFRVAEEGFSSVDYMNGLQYLSSRENKKQVHALCLPGVGDPVILEATQNVCRIHKSILIASQKDLFDYLTAY